MLDIKCKAYYTLNISIVHFTFFYWRNKLKNRIQELRKAQKVTQMELAEAVDVTRQTIISLENGKYNASLVLAHKIAQYFQLSIEEIFIFEEEENL